MDNAAMSAGGNDVMIAYETLLLLRHKANISAAAAAAVAAAKDLAASEAMDIEEEGGSSSSGSLFVGKFSDNVNLIAEDRESALAGVKRKLSSVESNEATFPSSSSSSLQQEIDSQSLEILEEENSILLHQFCKIIQQSFGFGAAQQKHPDLIIAPKHWRVAATAIVYMLKFYANNSLLTHDPRVVMVTSLFIAGKSEESYVSIKELQQVHKGLLEEEVKKYEYILLEALDFNLRVYHPNNILPTIIADMKKVTLAAADSAGDSGGSMSVLGQELSSQASQVLASLQLSYALLCCSPLAVALFSLELTQAQLCAAAASNTGVFIGVERYIEIRYGEAFHTQYNSYCKPPLQFFLDKSKAGVSTNHLKKYLNRLKTSAVWSKK